MPKKCLDSLLENGEALCAMCSVDNGGCCVTDPAHAHFTFPLSNPEWERITPHAHLILATAKDEINSSEWWSTEKSGDIIRKKEKNAPEFIQAMKRIFPYDKKKIDKIFPSNQEHYRLRTTPKGSCAFLSPSGCVLPREVRPWYCLIFPGWVIAWEVTLFTSDTCLIAKNAQTPEEGLRLLNRPQEHIFDLYNSLRKDWGLSPRK